VTLADERLARLETKVDALQDGQAILMTKIDGKLSCIEMDVVRLKMQVKWVIGFLALTAAGSGGAVGLLKFFGV